MGTAIYATLFHSISTDQKPQHFKCPTGKDSWCFFQAALARGEAPGHHVKHVKTPIKESHLAKIMPIYQRLASNELLHRCIRFVTQNANESLHSIIWGKMFKRNVSDTASCRRPGQGRRRATAPNEDLYLVFTARRHRNMNAILLPQHLHSATGTTVSTQTVRNRLHGVGLYARRPMVCVRLTSRHRRDRWDWATEHVKLRRNEWSNVLFSDESRFSVHLGKRRIFIWRERGSRNNLAFVHESVRFGGGGVLVYGGISIDGRTDLYIIRDGPLTVRQYRDEILRLTVVPYAVAVGDDFILMEDNCRLHRANLVEDFLFEERIVRMEWPACSPDMN
ncbi:transposable element Tcb2 transposase [Trichonephila clavipes]|nr:transposable element Tcb2 transposase [Trichonephila clavipes]